MNESWPFKEDPDQLVAHYTRFETVVCKILPSRRLRFSPASQVNDLLESDAQFCSMYGIDHELIPPDINPQINKSLQNRIKLFCTCWETNETGNSNLLGRLYAKPMMWTHYGDNFKGVCLLFDKAKLHNAISDSTAIVPNTLRSYTFDSFNYMDNIDHVFRTYSTSYGEYNRQKYEQIIQDIYNYTVDSIFSKKHKDWAQENEHRWVFLGTDEQEVLIDFRESLVAVVVGNYVHENLLYSLKAALKDFNVSVYKLDRFEGSLSLHRLFTV